MEREEGRGQLKFSQGQASQAEKPRQDPENESGPGIKTHWTAVCVYVGVEGLRNWNISLEAEDFGRSLW